MWWVRKKGCWAATLRRPPCVPLENTVANLNIDMIGRTDAEHPDDPRYVYLIGSDKLSSELCDQRRSQPTFTNLALDYTSTRRTTPTDLLPQRPYNFAKNNIPVIFYFTGVHEDYHKPGDDAHKIMYPKMAEIGKLVFHTAGNWPTAMHGLWSTRSTTFRATADSFHWDWKNAVSAYPSPVAGPLNPL